MAKLSRNRVRGQMRFRCIRDHWYLTPIAIPVKKHCRNYGGSSFIISVAIIVLNLKVTSLFIKDYLAVIFIVCNHLSINFSQSAIGSLSQLGLSRMVLFKPKACPPSA